MVRNRKPANHGSTTGTGAPAHHRTAAPQGRVSGQLDHGAKHHESLPGGERGEHQHGALRPRPQRAEAETGGRAVAHQRRSATARSSAMTVPTNPSTSSPPWTWGKRSVVSGAGRPSRSNAASSPPSNASPPGSNSVNRTGVFTPSTVQTKARPGRTLLLPHRVSALSRARAATWARPASSRAIGTRNGEHET